MAYWLVKSEPNEWSWDDHLREGVAEWDGVRNAQAQNHMKSMAEGDKVLFYHSGRRKEVVGLAEVVREHYPDPTDEKGKAEMVDLKALRTLPDPVPLSRIKADDRLADLPLVRQPRLSVMPIDDRAWRIICHELGGLGQGEA